LQTLIVFNPFLLRSFNWSANRWSAFSQIDWSFWNWVLFWSTHVKSRKQVFSSWFDWIFQFERYCINV